MEKRIIATAACVLFLFGVFCFVDGLIALLRDGPCWIVRMGFGPLSITLTGVLGFLGSRVGGRMRELKALMLVGYWFLLVGGLISLGLGIYLRFVRFDEFKLWQWAIALGIAILALSGVLAFLRRRVE
jgi:hypothetical protein